MIARAQPPVIRQWRRMIGRHPTDAPPRPMAGLGYLASGPVLDGLIEIEKLLLVVLYDEPTDVGRCPLRLAGFSGAAVPWGARWGGPEQSKFVKDLGLQPVPHARGRRIDVTDSELLELGLQLQRQLERHAHCRWLPVRQQVQLPRLWAGFRRSDVPKITADGPELAAVCRRRRKSARRLLDATRRTHVGLVLYPLPWVSHHWQQAALLFADLRSFPKRQVFSVGHLPGDLQGYQGAVEFDFFNSRFRRSRQRHRRRKTRRRMPLAAAG